MAATVRGAAVFAALRGRVVLNPLVRVTSVVLEPSLSRKAPVFLCHTLRIDTADEHWAAYWMHAAVFPNVERIELDADPGEAYVLEHWGRRGISLILDRRFALCKVRWAAAYNNVQVADLGRSEVQLRAAFPSKLVLA